MTHDPAASAERWRLNQLGRESSANEQLRSMVQSMAELASWYGHTPDPAENLTAQDDHLGRVELEQVLAYLQGLRLRAARRVRALGGTSGAKLHADSEAPTEIHERSVP